MKSYILFILTILTLSTVAEAQVNAIGNFDSINKLSGGRVTLSGWICVVGRQASIKYNVVSFGPRGFEIVALGLTADDAHEEAVGKSCMTTNSKHRYLATIDAATVARLEGNQFRIYPAEQGVTYAPVGGDLLNPYGEAIGTTDLVTQNLYTGDLTVIGWACYWGKNQNASVLLSAGPASEQLPLGASITDQVSEQGVKDACGNSHATNRFKIVIPGQYLVNKNGKKLHTQIVIQNGGPFVEVYNSGKYTLNAL